MSFDPITLTSKQVDDLHNAKCDLHQVIETLSDVVKPAHLREITNVCTLINFILKPAYKADDKKEKALQKLAEPLETETIARYSTGFPPHVTICEGRARFVLTSGWTDPKEITYRSEIIDNPTYADAFEAFKQSIIVTKDTHHVFFEGVKCLVAPEDVRLYILLSGS